MKRKTIPAFFLALALVFSLSTGALAAGTTTATVPVTLTVSNEYRAVNVTVPAALPVYVINATVVTADNARITNNAKTGSVQVTGLSVTDGAYKVGSYDSFSGSKTIALKINGCVTTGTGRVQLTSSAFPVIAAGGSQKLTYFAKVSGDAPNSKDVQAANVVFTISIVDYWFTGCTALTMAEIPYTTPVIGAAAFADCPSLRQIQLYYSGAFTIAPGAFSTGSLTPLLVLFIPEYDSVLGTLAAYDWTEDRRAAYFEDVYGITLLATGYCSNCKRTCSYTVEYEQWTNSEHCVRHWCSNCGYDQAGGVNGEAHSFRSGVCSKCGYSNGSGGGGGGGGNVCYHSSTRTSWSGCDWYEYCRSCGALVDYGTSHGTYVYGAWEYYSSSQHRRSYACSDCGEGTYRYASHSVSTQYAQYSAAQHRTVQSCSVCNATLSSSYSAHMM